MNSLFTPEKAGILVGAIAIIGFGIFGAWWLSKPSWVPVLAGQEDLQMNAQLQNYLMDWNVPFRESDAGNILVEESNIIEVRKHLSDVGIPNKSQPGLELFSEAEYGMSEFTQRINFQRAIEAELARTIRSFSEIKSARVHLTIPKESIFKDRQGHPKASVSIQTIMDQPLSDESVTGIKNLVSASVDNLKAKDVIVLDQDGNQISSVGDDPAKDKKRSKNDIEKYYAEKARNLVFGIVQTDNIQVAVNTQHNYDKVRSVKEQVIAPEGEDTGFILKSNSQVRDGKISAKKDDKAGSTVISEKEYIYSTERSEIEYAIGELELLSIGIVITKDIDRATVEEIEKVVAAGLGLNVDRGDRIAVVAVPPSVPANPNPVNSGVVEAASKVKYNAGFTDTTMPGSRVDSSADKLPPEVFAGSSQNKMVLLASVFFFVLFIIFFFVWYFYRPVKSQNVASLSNEDKQVLLEDLKHWLAKDRVEDTV